MPLAHGCDLSCLRTAPPLLCTGAGVDVTPYVFSPTKQMAVPDHDKAFKCHLVVSNVYADAPARDKVLNAVPFSGFMGCTYCLMSQLPHESGQGRSFAGYTKAIPVYKGPLRKQMRQMVSGVAT